MLTICQPSTSKTVTGSARSVRYPIEYIGKSVVFRKNDLAKKKNIIIAMTQSKNCISLIAFESITLKWLWDIIP